MSYKRVKTPTVIQMEAVECGAAALTIILRYWGRWVSLEEMRHECGVSRDGVKAGNIVRTAQRYGLIAKGFRKEPENLPDLPLPMVVFWNFNHFLVVEGFSQGEVFLNDPASGPRRVSRAEFDLSFTGVAITFERGPDFQTESSKPSLWRSLRAWLAGSWGAVGFVFLASLLLMLPGLMVAGLSRVFVDHILLEGQGWLGPLLGLLALMLVCVGLLTALQKTYLLRLETKLALSHSAQYFWFLMHLPMSFFTQRQAGEIVNRLQINDRLATLLSRDLASTLLSVVLIGAYALLMLSYDLWLTLITIGMAGLNLLALQYFSRKRRDANTVLLQEQGKIAGTAMHGLLNIEVLKARGLEGDFFARLLGYHAKTVRQMQKLGLYTQILTAIPPALTLLSTSLILIIGSWRAMNTDFSLGMLVAFQTLMLAFLAPINQLLDLGSKLQQLEGDMNRLDDVLHYQSPPPSQQIQVPPGQSQLSGRVELRNLSFGYNRIAPPLLENFSLSLEPGARVAIVGASGSGKSTVAKLICGLYEPWEGEILFDGIPRQALPASLISHSLSMVDQDIFMFEDSIRQNLSLWDRTIAPQRLVQAAKDAAIHELITSRPNGYDHLVEEDGRNFSGGQRQRLEIARALATDPTILVLDEATSALDPVVEKEIDENLRRRGCTTIIVAHRLSTIRDADEIIVLERGRVVQRGTHDELYRQKGAYRQLVSLESTENNDDPLRSIFNRLEF
jgi:NHLM bacteriocin system ABC transporter peptidase/ATP-binding protein